MSLSPIARLIDAAIRCLKCGRTGPVGSCGCWVRLECPDCPKRRWVEPDATDPPGVVRVVYPCPDHDQEDSPPPRYFDGAGAEIHWNEQE